MGQNSKIEWTDHTFSPWWGCTKVSSGCANCYAETFSNRFGSWFGKDSPRRFFDQKHWGEPLKWDRKAAKAGIKSKVFCGSMCDVFEDRPDLVEPRKQLYELILKTPNMIWMLLTKRPQNMQKLLPKEWLSFGAYTELGNLHNQSAFPQNVWLGISAENQEQFHKRWPILEWIGRHWKSPVLFISAEPLLGPLNISGWAEPQYREISEDVIIHTRGIDWVICGGESGLKARPMHPDWPMELLNDCDFADIPFFFKQQGEWAPVSEFTGSNGANLGGKLRHVLMGNQKMQFVGKKLAGALLDGQEYKQFPEVK
jgi:protein gp37